MAFVLIAPLLGLMSAAPESCQEARNHYEMLAFEPARASIDRVLQSVRPAPLDCLEVKALIALTLGQPDAARALFEQIFARDVEYRVEDPALSPAMRDTIESIRNGQRSLRANVEARWIVHGALRLDVELTGGLRGAKKIRFVTVTLPQAEQYQDNVRLVGRAATATVAVTAEDVAQLRVTGLVVDADGEVLHRFQNEVAIPGRPDAPQPEKVLVEVEKDSGPSWLLWLGLGAAVVAGSVTAIVLAQPGGPTTDGTLGRIPVSR